MDNNITALQNDASNRKKAYFAMCKVTLVLLFFAFSSRFVSDIVVDLLKEENGSLQQVFVEIFSFFGIDGQNSREAAKMLLSSTALHEVLSIIISFVTLVIPAIVFRRCTYIKDEECFELSGKTVKWIIPMFFLCQLVTSLVSAFSQSLYGFLAPGSAFAMEAASGVVSSEFDAYEFAVCVLCSCILVPIVEEFVFRGIIFTYLKRYGLCFAVVASASLFGVAHSFPTQTVYAFSFGVFSAFLCVVTGNIKTSLVFHAVNNLITVCAGYIMGSADEFVAGIFNAAFVMLVTSLGFAALYKMFAKGGYFDVFSEKAKENDGEINEKCGLKEILAFPFAAYVIYYVFNVTARVLVNI